MLHAFAGDALWRDLLDETRRLVEQHWSEILVVARGLQIHGSLFGFEIQRIVPAHRSRHKLEIHHACLSQSVPGEIATLGDKNDGNENQSFINKKYRPDKDSDDGGHYGKPVGIITYDGSEFHCRVSAQNRDWHFRGLSVDAVKDQIRRFFPDSRGRIRFEFSRAADLARYGEHASVARL